MFVKANESIPENVFALWDSANVQLDLPYWLDAGHGGALIMGGDKTIYEVVETEAVRVALREHRIVEVEAPVVKTPDKATNKSRKVSEKAE